MASTAKEASWEHEAAGQLTDSLDHPCVIFLLGWSVLLWFQWNVMIVGIHHVLD